MDQGMRFSFYVTGILAFVVLNDNREFSASLRTSSRAGMIQKQ